ncbi:kinase-like domain-containing protein [Pilaira anomala]|nr:kinase-like domain-containing protein [Pilaira anomala]
MNTRRNMTTRSDINKSDQANKARQTINKRMTRSSVPQIPTYIKNTAPCSSKPSVKRTAAGKVSFGSQQDSPVCLDDNDYVNEPSSSTGHYTNEIESLDIANRDVHMSSDIEYYLHVGPEANTFDESDPNIYESKESYLTDDHMNEESYKPTPTKVSRRNSISRQAPSKVTKKTSNVTKSTKNPVGPYRKISKASEQGPIKRSTRHSTAATGVGFAFNSSASIGPASTHPSQHSTDPVIFMEPKFSPAVNFAFTRSARSSRSAQLIAKKAFHNNTANIDNSLQTAPTISSITNTANKVNLPKNDAVPIRCSKRNAARRISHDISKPCIDSICSNEPAIKLQPEAKATVEKDTSKNTARKSLSRTSRRAAAEIAAKAITESIKLPPLHVVNESDDDIYEARIDNTEPDGGEIKSNGEEYLQMILNDPILASFRIENRDLVVDGRIIGEGQTGIVTLGSYRGLPVACKTKRSRVNKASFYSDIFREITYAQILKYCRFTNNYIGWTYCESHEVEPDVPETKKHKKLYLVQRFIENGDARSYINNRAAAFGFFEVLQAALCLFTALNDIHGHDIGLVDLKLENFLIDHSGTGFLTDFGSSISFFGREKVDLDEEKVAWTVSVSAPEMIKDHSFTKASDVFMATLIISELMTADLTDNEFRKKVLRRKPDGDVSFSPELIDPSFSRLFQLLELGLANDPADRPTAGEMLDGFFQAKQSPSAD